MKLEILKRRRCYSKKYYRLHRIRLNSARCATAAANKSVRRENRRRRIRDDPAFAEKERKRKAATSKRHRRKSQLRENLRRETDANFKLSKNLRHRVRQALKGISKSASTLELVGCTIERLMHHLESKFQPGMTWDNYGFGEDKWHIDHIRPIKSFDLQDPAQQHICFNWKNLQPLWQPDNFKKGGK